MDPTSGVVLYVKATAKEFKVKIMPSLKGNFSQISHPLLLICPV